MAIRLQRDEQDHIRQNDAINQTIDGRINAIGDMTLANGATSTTVTFANCSKGCRVFLFPQNATARAVTVSVDPADTLQGSFIARHAAAPASAKFSFLCIGG